MTTNRDFNTNPRRVIIQLEFFVYDNEPVDRLQENVNAMCNDRLLQEQLLSEFADTVHGDSSLNDMTAMVII